MSVPARSFLIVTARGIYTYHCFKTLKKISVQYYFYAIGDVTEVSRGFPQFHQRNDGVLSETITSSFHSTRPFRLIRPIFEHSVTRRSNSATGLSCCSFEFILYISKPHQLIGRFACPNLRQSKCSKYQNENSINNWTP
jgi:hypothetical protein